MKGVVSAPQPAARPRPDLAWLAHPAITGMPVPALDVLTAALAGPAAARREARNNRRRGDRPSRIAPGTGRRPQITLTAKLTAALLHDRHGLTQRAIAALYQVRPEQTWRALAGTMSHRAGWLLKPQSRQ